MRAPRFWPLLLLTLSAVLKAQPCGQPDLDTAQKRVKAIQSQLLAVKLEDEIDESVPAPLQKQISTFKDAFAVLAHFAVLCAPADVDSQSLESDLAKRLDANKPVAQEVYDPNKPPQLDHIYGSDLKVKVSRPQNKPQLLLVEFNFGIECGYDSLLLAYEQRGGAWKQVLRWQSPVYDRIDAAFGDFFDYIILPDKDSPSWSIAAAHGHPWCTSNFSAFDIDILGIADDHTDPQLLAHKNLGYRRETDPVMKPEPDGFELKMTGSSIDGGIVMRPVIYRYEVIQGQLERVQPIANNGRDFVDEWLESPWSDSARWSAVPGQAQLEQIHKRIASLQDPNAKDIPMLSFGPVRGCSDSPSHFQVELNEEWVDSKGKPRNEETTYFQVEEGKNSFTMLSAPAKANPDCTGSDIMAKR